MRYSQKRWRVVQKLVVFDLSGQLYLDDGGWFDVSDIKYEGLDFVM